MYTRHRRKKEKKKGEKKKERNYTVLAPVVLVYRSTLPSLQITKMAEESSQSDSSAEERHDLFRHLQGEVTPEQFQAWSEMNTQVKCE